MTKFADHPNGFRISSDNVFFVIDRAREKHSGEPPIDLSEGIGEIRDGYRATVHLRHYSFDRDTMLTVGIRTPAHQMCYEHHELTWERSMEVQGKVLTYPWSLTYFVLRPWLEKWLNENVGPKYDRWDTYTRSTESAEGVFFKRRKDALALVRMINHQLAGLKIGTF